MNKCFENQDPLCQWTAKYTNKPLIINGNIKSPQLLEEAAILGCANWYAMDQSIFERLQWYEFLERKIEKCVFYSLCFICQRRTVKTSNEAQQRKENSPFAGKRL